MDLGDPLRVIEVTPAEHPFPEPVELPELEPAEDPVEVPA